MFGIGEGHKVIEVKFIEGNSDTPFAVSTVPIEQLPDTFEINTTLHLGQDDWRVIGADPAKKSEFRKLGKLSLYLAKQEVMSIDPKELLYSLPTIYNDLPGVEPADSLENVIVIREDDWRQFEFIDVDHESTINEELNDVLAIYQNHKQGMGFTSLHLRQKISNPLGSKKLTIEILRNHFSFIKVYDGVAFDTAAVIIINSFAAQTDTGWILWGQTDLNENITVLNISASENANIRDFAETLDKFLEDFSLYLVDWPRLFWGGANKASFAKYDD